MCDLPSVCVDQREQSWANIKIVAISATVYPPEVANYDTRATTLETEVSPPTRTSSYRLLSHPRPVKYFLHGDPIQD